MMTCVEFILCGRIPEGGQKRKNNVITEKALSYIFFK